MQFCLSWRRDMWMAIRTPKFAEGLQEGQTE